MFGMAWFIMRKQIGGKGLQNHWNFIMCTIFWNGTGKIADSSNTLFGNYFLNIHNEAVE